MTTDPISYLKRCGRERAAVVAALALLDQTSHQGDVPLKVRDAYAVITGFVDLIGWNSLDASTQAQVAQLLGLRSARLANLTAFLSRAQEVLDDPRAPYAAGPPDTFVRATLLEPDAIAQAALTTLANRPRRKVDDREAIGGGPARLRAYGRGDAADAFTYTIPASEFPDENDVALDLLTRPATGPVSFALGDLLETAWRLGEREPSLAHLHPALSTIISRLVTADRQPTRTLLLEPGTLDLLVAPTGVGKSVLVTVLSVHAALKGLRIAIAVPDIAASRKLAHELDLAASAVGLPGAVATALTPYRVWGVVSQGLDQAASDDPDGSWALAQFGYTCWLSAFEDQRRWLPGNEPCRGQLRPDGEETPVDCPFLNQCERTSGQRRALTAPITVINHHALLDGAFQGSLKVDGESRPRATMLEVVLRGCHIVLVDEIDRLQVAGISLATRHFELANRGVIETPLSRLERDLAGLVPPAPGRLPDEDRFRTVVRSTAWLADRYLALHEHDAPLNSAADGELHYALAQDRRLAARLLLDDNVDATAEESAALVGFAADLLQDLCDGRVVDDGRRKDLAANNGLDLDVALAALRPSAADPEGFDRVRSLTEALVVPRARGGDPDLVLAEIANELQQWLPQGQNAVAAAHELAHRAFRLHLNQWLSQLTLRLPGMERGGIVSAGSLAEDLARPGGPQVIPLGPLGGLRFGFRVDSQSRPKLSAQMATGDPHRTIANLGDAISQALAGSKRVVVGLSATAWLPGAPRSHVLGRLKWVVPDDQAEALRVLALPVVAPDARPIRISGVRPSNRLDRLETLGRGLWEQHLRTQLDDLAASGEGRHKVLVVTASYPDTDALALGLVAAMGPDALGRVVRLVPRNRDPQRLGLTTTTTIDRLPEFVSDPTASILVAPLAAVARGHNIVGTDGRSALGAIYVCVRPLPPDRDPQTMLARVNAYATRVVERHPDLSSGEAVALLQSKAFARLHQLIAQSGPFSRQPLDMRLEVIVEMLADLIQLAGRARRGGTTATMYLVDAAFHEPGATRDASLASHIAELVNKWDADGELADLLWIYEATLGAFARPPQTEETTK